MSGDDVLVAFALAATGCLLVVVLGWFLYELVRAGQSSPADREQEREMIHLAKQLDRMALVLERNAFRLEMWKRA